MRSNSEQTHSPIVSPSAWMAVLQAQRLMTKLQPEFSVTYIATKCLSKYPYLSLLDEKFVDEYIKAIMLFFPLLLCERHIQNRWNSETKCCQTTK